jgi:heat shock protein HslJ
MLVLACNPKVEPPPAGGNDAGGTPGPGGSELKLDGRVFLSQRVTEGGKPRALVEGTQLTLSFHEGSRIGANAGCNSMGGRYAIEGGKLVISDAAITEMACPGVLDQEAWYMKLLQSKPTVAQDGDALVLESGGTRIEYLDRDVATPDVPLTGRTWTVDTIVTAETASHAAWPTPATLVFEPGGGVTLHTGCNTGSSTYEVKGEEITFTPPGITKMACQDPLVIELERAVLGLLGGPQPVTWEITVDRLSLRGKDFGLDLKASKG